MLIRINIQSVLAEEGKAISRLKREWYAGAAYHVMSRGNRQGIIYREEEDYLIFLHLLKRVCAEFNVKLDCYCLMTNHFHMIIQTQEFEIWKFMKKLLECYAKYFNSKYDFKGHLFEKRYTSCLIEDDIYLLEASRYIHLNPVKAHMVREPLDYAYSSYKKYMQPEEKDTIDETELDLRQSRILGCFKCNQREQYRMFVEGKISHFDKEIMIQKQMGEDENWLPW